MPDEEGTSPVYSVPTTLRLLTEKDVPAAMELSTQAGWNQTPEDWRTLIQLDSKGCFGVEVEDRLVATTTLLCYGRALAWVGMVLTRIEWRGRGFAQNLLATALARADQLGIATVKLDATDQGQPVYEKLGFRREQPIERWFREGLFQTSEQTASEKTLKPACLDLDSEAFGTDRAHLVRELGKRSTISSTTGAYLFSRPGRVSDYIGPCIAKNRDAAKKLIEARIRDSSARTWFWDIISRNQDAVSLAQELGFKPQRRLLRMVRGKELSGNDSLIYAIAGFELG
jgi:GNAT superfamily N-acetyltransferase